MQTMMDGVGTVALLALPMFACRNYAMVSGESEKENTRARMDVLVALAGEAFAG